jgi:hypothetical protein
MKYDKRMIKDFQGEPAEAQLVQCVQKWRVKYDTCLLPPVERIGVLSNTPDGDGEEERKATLRTLAEVRADHVRHVVAVYNLMAELEFYDKVLNRRG